MWRNLRPMLATLENAPLKDAGLLYEPKYDGIRALVEIDLAGGDARVGIWSRLGNLKTSQFPEIARALQDFARRLKTGVVLDGEIVALDARGEPAGFEKLQGRIHLAGLAGDSLVWRSQPAAFIAFDLIRQGDEDLRACPLAERRARLEKLFGAPGARKPPSPLLRLSDAIVGDGRKLYQRAVTRGWEGIIAKSLRSTYQDGRRSPAWRKIKLVKRQEFVVGGWTEPRESRPFFGALLLGVYEGDRLQYVGHTGSGFTQAELARVAKILAPLETATCPFDPRPQTNERPHWVTPQLVADVKFAEWTDAGRLRQPIYLGVRDDKDPTTVRRED